MYLYAIQLVIQRIIYTFNNIILHCVAFRCILPPGWGASPKRNHISHLSYFGVQGLRGSGAHEFKGSWVQGFKGSWVQGFMGSRVQGFRGSRAHGLRGSRVHVFKSRYAIFKRCYAAFKDLTSFDLQTQLWGSEFFFEHCKAVERHEVPLESYNTTCSEVPIPPLNPL
ncbi:MAG: hypothetical protein PWP06_1586 [Candidatus Marinimicrobia bacterium]|nr:hypothetical protein [Candidatus Neomarinimicrobiota bacterium]